MSRFRTRLEALTARLRRRRDFLRNTRGVAAMEFALFLPFMALLYFGAVELSMLVAVDRKVTATASTMADLVARVGSVNTAEMNDVFDASRSLFVPYNSANVRLRVSSVVDNAGTARVEWSRAKNTTPLAVNATVAVGSGVVPSGGSVIMAEVEYDYTSALGFFLRGTKTMTETFYLRPRASAKVEWSSS